MMSKILKFLSKFNFTLCFLILFCWLLETPLFKLGLNISLSPILLIFLISFSFNLSLLAYDAKKKNLSLPVLLQNRLQAIINNSKKSFSKIEQKLAIIYQKQTVKWRLLPILLLIFGLGLFTYGTLTTGEAFSVIIDNHKDEIKVDGDIAKIEFSAQANNLGIVGIPFEVEKIEQEIDFDEEGVNFEQEDSEPTFLEEAVKTKEEVSEDKLDQDPGEETIPSEKLVVFRIKQKDSWFWHDKKELSIDQFKNEDYFYFGFPVLENSQGKQIIVEIESQAFSNQTLKISDQYPNYVTKYKFNKSTITATPQSFLAYSAKKITNNAQNYPISFVLTVLLFPIFYLITRIYFEKANPNGDYLNLFAKNLFLILLLIITIASFDFSFFGEKFTNSYVINDLKSLNSVFVCPTILIGLIAFYKNKEIIKKRVEKEQKREHLAEQKRAKEFSVKHPHLAQIPVLRYLFKWIYKEGALYSFSLFILILLSSCLLFYKLGDYELREDEFQVVGAATCYYYEQKFCEWDWLKGEPGDSMYTRAWPHSWLIAQSYHLFGISEWSSRFPSAVFGVFFTFILYFIAKFFTESKKIGLLASTGAVFYPAYINIFRYARMYALLIPLFTLLIYFLYRGLTENAVINKKDNQITQVIKTFFNFKYSFLGLSLLLLWLNYKIHINSLVILPSVLIFSFIMALSNNDKDNKKFKALSVGGLILIITTIIIYILGITDRLFDLLSFFNKRNFIYLNFLTEYPLGSAFGKILLLLGLVSLKFWKKRKRMKLIYLYSIVVFSLIFFIYIADRYSSFLYISHITPISIILIISSFFLLSKIFARKTTKLIFTFVFLAFLLTKFYQSKNSIYKNETNYGKFSEAYQVITRNYNPENQVIFGQYLRTYYLKELAPNAKIISMENNKNYEFENFINDLKKFDSGYITWETRKSYHISSDIIKFIDNNFIKLHGQNLDNTNVEVYYFDPETKRASLNAITF